MVEHFIVKIISQTRGVHIDEIKEIIINVFCVCACACVLQAACHGNIILRARNNLDDSRSYIGNLYDVVHTVNFFDKRGQQSKNVCHP